MSEGEPEIPFWRRRLRHLADVRGFDATITRRLEAEALFAGNYLHNFGHGTDGHIRLVLIALLVELLGDE